MLSAVKLVTKYINKSWENRYKSGKVATTDLTDITIDNYALHDVGCIEIEGWNKKVAPIFTIVQCLIY